MGGFGDDRRDLRGDAIFGALPGLASANHGAWVQRRDVRHFSKLELVLVRLHPPEGGVLEDFRPLVFAALEAEEPGDPANRGFEVTLHVGEMEQQHVVVVAQRPPGRDDLEDPTDHSHLRHRSEEGGEVRPQDGLFRHLPEIEPRVGVRRNERPQRRNGLVGIAGPVR